MQILIPVRHGFCRSRVDSCPTGYNCADVLSGVAEGSETPALADILLVKRLRESYFISLKARPTPDALPWFTVLLRRAGSARQRGETRTALALMVDLTVIAGTFGQISEERMP